MVNQNVSNTETNAVDDSDYTIGTVRFVNVKNKLSEKYEIMVGDIAELIESNRTAEAMQLAQELVDNNMSNEVAWLFYANAKEAWGDKALAKKGFEQALAINPRFALALNDFGAFWLGNEDAETAMVYFKKALEYDPKNTQYMRNVAYNLMFTDSYGAAIEKCEYFVSISDEKTYSENKLGEIYVQCCNECVYNVPIDTTVSDCSEINTEISELREEIEVVEELNRKCIAGNSNIALNQEGLQRKVRVPGGKLQSGSRPP